MKKFKKVILFSIPLALVLLSPLAFAQDVTTGGGACTGDNCQKISSTLTNPFKCSSLTGTANCDVVDFFQAIVDKVLLPIGSVLAVIFFVLAGFKFVTAGGDEKKVAEARSALLYTAIGTAILLGAKVIADVIANTIHSLQ